ncbi:MAG TPA: type I polyketide synthase, partial [Pseudonocardiaceae bacterium]|nr:type I polyketide synthase [Pseudonocardiaceae bacterium]
MTAPVERYVEALRSSLKEVERLRQQNQELVAASGEPIAIVGMACRFPGDVATPEDLWRLVAEGRDAISAFPADRGWPDRIPGDTDADVTREGGFVRDIVEFDADFFGISPREALAMDPQQRVLLETAWEALERTGLDASALRGSRTGVFVGASGSGYTPPTELRGHLLTGQVISMISGRLAYTLGLQGPAVTVDTACSSSLVALHLAGQALRSDECSLALAAGVTVMATPAAFAEFGVQGGVAPDGRCKPFSDSADGTGWAEGCGVLVLERLSDARRNGHRILALVRGSAVNSDGASNGLTAPSGPAQRRVIRQALLSARLEAGDVDVVEAHGTGTTLGDPIEAQALLATYGQDRDRPLLLGSIKSNIGHTQAASGVAGVIKMVLAIRNGSVPRTLHVTEPSSHVDWSAGAVRLATEPVPWPAVDRPRRAAISSFGMSGTNAHVILEQTPPAEPTAERVRPESTDPMPWSLSARTEAALRDQAARLLSYLDREADQRPVDIGHTLATGRSLFEYRAVMVGKDDAELRDGLRALAADQPAPLLVTGSAANPRKVVFVFPGQGSQWVGMAAELKASSPVFAERLAECAAALSEYVDWDLDEVLGDEEALRRVDVVQPASWAVMVALAGLWRCHGVEPAAVVGHSQGEIAAACVAGALSLSEAALVVSLRSKAIAESLAGHGGMVSVALPVATVQRRLAELPEVSIAAVNGPASVVVSGPGATMDALVEAWAGEGVRARRVEVDYASHSAQVEVLRPRLMDLLAPIRPATATIPFHSTVTATPLDTKELTADYWYRNLRQTVQFGQTVSSLVESGCGLFIEISPHPVLLQGISQVIEQSNSGAAAIGTLRRDDGGLRRFLLSAAEAHVNGGTVDWTPALRGGRLADLPTAPFQRTRFWPESPEGVTTPDLRYRVTWKGLTVAGNSALDGPWLVAVPPGPVEDEWICAAIAELGETVRVEVGGTDRAQLADSLRVLAVDRTPFAGVLSFLAIQEEPASSVPESVTSTMLLAQALGDADIDAPLWCATRGAVAIDDTERVTDPAQVAVWGLGRVAAMEYPWRWGGLVDLPPTLDASTAARLADALGGTEDQIALRPGGVFGRRVSRAGSAGTRFSPRGTVLITGGTGALGGHTARWLARNGAERLLLVSRRGPAAPGADRLAAELAALGAQIDVIACDVADRQALTALLEHHRLTGVVHAAGVLDDGVLDGLTPERFESVFRAKVTPALLLDELTRDHDLSMFLLFSSMAGLVGAPGQASYAAANAHLDGLAEQRRGQGLPATAIAWGAWAGAGLAAQTRRADLARHGLALMDPAAAIATLPDVVDGPDAVALITDVDWDRYAPALAVDRPHPLLSDLPRVLERATTRPSGSQWRRSLSDLPATSRRAMVLDTVRAQAAAVLGHTDLAAIGPDRAFRDLGFDSLTAVELRNRLTATTGLSLPSSLVFDHPSPAVLVDFLLAELAELTGEQTGTANPAPIATVNTDDPIVIVGMACRYPAGIASPQDLWQLVAAGTDAISGFPTDRGWPTDSLDGTTVREGGFLLDAAEFDADFFGISPREALAMDPQQRLLLETSWEALEQAGIAPTGLKGSRGGVFIGAGQVGYGALLEHSVEDLRGHLLTGSSSSAMSGRISYTLGLEGPAVTVDTACSSSLVALHLAAQALRSGECDLALAGGVTVIPTPNVFEEFSRQGGLAVDGRCKSFSDAADGTGWSEGVGVVVVERLSDACRNGHQVLAVVRGSAVNQDGASNGLTAPNGPSQQRVIRQALAQAGLSTGDVDVVEAHGTGTRLGDPIEAQALLATYGRDRAEDRPLLLGSIKSNIGHTQAAAGVAGIIKMVLAMRNGVIPATLHVDSPSSQVDWTAGAVQLATEAVDWPETGRARRAGVSSFGISGTNAHIILEQAPATEAADNAQLDGVVPWVVSARTAEALDSQLDQLRSFTEAAPDLSSRDVGFSLATGRSVFEHRAVLLADANGAREIARGTAATQGVVFVFSGQGSQWVGMGRELYARCPVFAEAFDEVCVHLEVFLDEEGVESTGRAQPALFAIEVALFRLLLSWGVRPDYLIGHSVGEIAAAHVAGVFSLVDACRLVSARADLMQALPEGGVMVAARATEAEVRPLLSGNVCLAAVNGPHALVLSGPEDEVHAVTATLDEQGHKVTPLRVSHAFHSTLMRPMLAEFQAVAETLSFAPPSLSLVSTVTGTPIDDSRWCSPQYWVDQVEHTVRFADALRWVGTQGPHAVIEIGPGGGLAAAAAQTLGDEVVAVPSLRPQHDEQTAVITAVARLHAHGVFVDWPALFTEARPVTLPTYAFQRRRYWPRLGARPGDPGGLGLLALRHPLLGAGVELPGSGGFLCTGRLSLAACPWLADHRVMGSVVFPGAGFLELVVHVADQVACNQISELTLHTPLVLLEEAGADIQVVVDGPNDAGERDVRVFARVQPSDPWVCHASGVVSPAPAELPEVDTPLGANTAAVDITDFYAHTEAAGFGYGPMFQGLKSVRRTDDEVVAEVALPAGDHTGFALHPALLDAALHTVWFAGLDQADRGRLPFSWRGVRVYASGATSARVRLRRTGVDSVSLVLVDVCGELVASVDSLVLREVPAGSLVGGVPAVPVDSLFELRWVPLPAVPVGESVDAAMLVVRGDGVGGGVPGVVRRVVGEVLGRVREQLSRDVPLVVVTCGAVGLGSGVVDVVG